MKKPDDFATIISSNFNEICKNFKIGLKKQGYKYNYDILADTFIRCHNRLQGKLMSKKEAIKYLWVAYINRLKNEYNKSDKLIDLPEEFDIVDDEYDVNIDKLYNHITSEVRKKFGDKITSLWVDYTCHNKTYNNIIEENPDINSFQYTLRKIKKFINNEIIKRDI